MSRRVGIGTDSGFEGRIDLYYDTVEVTLTPHPWPRRQVGTP